MVTVVNFDVDDDDDEGDMKKYHMWSMCIV